MTLRADHVAGAAFILFGAAIIALSGDLPVGRLSMPGSGFLPMIVAVLTMIFGLALIARASAESVPFSELDWADGKHALMVTAITAAAALLYEYLGFIVTMLLMMISFLARDRTPQPDPRRHLLRRRRDRSLTSRSSTASRLSLPEFSF